MTETQPPTPLAVGERQAIAEALRPYIGAHLIEEATDTILSLDSPSLGEGGVPASVYRSAVEGRQHFRNALREARGILSADERAVVASLCAELDLSEAGVLRQALRHYQLTHERLKAGETNHWSGDEQRARDFAGPLATPTTNAPVADLREAIARALLAKALRETAPGWELLAGKVESATNYENDTLHVSTALRAILAALSLTKNVATNADMREADVERLAMRLAEAHDEISGSPTKAVTAIRAGMDACADYWRHLARTVLQGDQP